MDREWLQRQLAEGRSIESLARELGKAPSTVAYWVNKHGLVSMHAARHRPRGGISREALESLTGQGLSLREIASALEVSVATVRHWLRRYGMRTRLAAQRGDDPESSAIVWQCPHHGWTRFHRIGRGRVRCARCNVEAVARRRRRVKELLVRENGGRCARCGFDEYAGALHFHHLERVSKTFEIGGRGLTRSIADLRAEVAKCVLLCANCHAMVEAEVATLPEALVSRAARRTMRGSSMAEQSAVNR
jgi:DNA-binding CsgD family transcriptional regulator